ncbi:MAG: cadherin-like beta sandwich domain-containing protein [Peptococcia bacterium]
MNVTATVEAGAQLYINGVSHTSGTAKAVPLNVGSNKITIEARIAGTTRTYTLTVTRAASNVNLSGLSTSPGTLSPAFAASTTNYTVTLTTLANSISVTATPADSGATVKINGTGGVGAQTVSVPIKAGENSIPVVITGWDGVTKKTYTIKVIRPSAVTALTISSGALDPAFSQGTLNYKASVGDRVNSLNVTATVEAGAQLYINGALHTSGTAKAVPLNVGSNKITIEARIAGTTRTYTLTVTRAASNVNLSGLSTSPGTLSPAFAASTTNYTVTLTTLANSISVTATPADSGASIKINGQGSGAGAKTISVPIKAGENSIPVVVTGWDGVTKKTYTIKVIRPSAVTALTISSGILSPSFSQGTLNYTASVGDRVNSLNVTATVEAGAQLYINGALQTSGTAKAVPLNVGSNKITIEARIAGTTRTYTLTVTRAASNVNLSGLSTSPGTLFPAFSASTTSYTVTLDIYATSIDVTATPIDSGATVKINGTGGVGAQTVSVPIKSGVNNLIPIVITGWDGQTTKTYTLKVIRPAYLTGLTVKNSAGQIQALNPEFAPGTLDYIVNKVANDITFLTVTAIVEDAAVLEVNGEITTSGTAKNIPLNVGMNYFTIKVTEPETKVVKTYTFEVYRTVNVNLSNLFTNVGNWDAKFSSGTTSYTVTLEKADSEITITAVPVDDQASVKIDGRGTGAGSQTISVPLKAGSNVLQIDVFGRDGEVTTKTYTLNVIKPASLSDVKISSGTLDPVFDKDTLNYTAIVADSVTSLEVTASAESGAEIYINGESGRMKNVPLNIGTNTITIEVKMADVSRTYKLVVTRATSNVNLSGLKTNIGTWDKTFTPENTSYTVTLDKAVETIDVTVTPADSEATVNVLQPVIDSSSVLRLDGKQESNGSMVATWNDLSGKDNHGELNNFAYTTGSGWTGEGLEFDGVNDYVEIANPLIQDSDFTISFWTKLNSIKNQCFFCTRTMLGQGVSIFALSNNTIRIDTSQGMQWITGYNIPVNTKTHIAVTKSNSNVSLYINGVFHSSTSSVGNMSSMSNIATLGISHISGGNFGNQLDGIIDGVCIYNRALTDVEVLQNYRAGQVPSGGRTVSVPLKSGQNSIPITVRGVDGVTTKTYTLNVIRPGALESLNIEPDTLTLEPEYAKEVNDYAVDSNVFLVKITPTLEDSTAQEIYININDSETDTKCVSGETLVLELNKGINMVAIKVKTPSNNLVNTYTLNVNVVPLVEDIGMGDFDDVQKVRSVFGAQVLSKLKFNLKERVNSQLNIGFNLTNSLEIQEVVGLYKDGGTETVTNNFAINAEGNKITINSSLEPGIYELKFLLTNEPIKLEVKPKFFDGKDGNIFDCIRDEGALEIEYVDFPELL